MSHQGVLETKTEKKDEISKEFDEFIQKLKIDEVPIEDVYDNDGLVKIKKMDSDTNKEVIVVKDVRFLIRIYIEHNVNNRLYYIKSAWKEDEPGFLEAVPTIITYKYIFYELSKAKDKVVKIMDKYNDVLQKCE